MNIDIAATLGAVVREVASREHEGRLARVIVATRPYDTGIEDLCEPPRVLGLTWACGGDPSWVTVTLAEDPKGGTRLELEHVAHVPDEWWKQYGPGAVGVGWDGALMGLGRYLETGVASDPQAAIAWMGSPQGKDFYRRASAASIASGTEPGAARAAAATTAFYTGESAPSA